LIGARSFDLGIDPLRIGQHSFPSDERLGAFGAFQRAAASQTGRESFVQSRSRFMEIRSAIVRLR
jgi:hypothetical protein